MALFSLTGALSANNHTTIENEVANDNSADALLPPGPWLVFARRPGEEVRALGDSLHSIPLRRRSGFTGALDRRPRKRLSRQMTRDVEQPRAEKSRDAEQLRSGSARLIDRATVSYTHLRAHETRHDLV